MGVGIIGLNSLAIPMAKSNPIATAAIILLAIASIALAAFTVPFSQWINAAESLISRYNSECEQYHTEIVDGAIAEAVPPFTILDPEWDYLSRYEKVVSLLRVGESAFDIVNAAQSEDLATDESLESRLDAAMYLVCVAKGENLEHINHE